MDVITLSLLDNTSRRSVKRTLPELAAGRISDDQDATAALRIAGTTSTQAVFARAWNPIFRLAAAADATTC